MRGGIGDHFYIPHRESSHWGVRDPYMSNQGVRHVRKGLLESDQITKQVWCMEFSTGKIAQIDMSGPGTRYVQRSPMESGDFTEHVWWERT
jgi:hypothetical protein